MKKLMILAAVVCAAVVSQASSVDWAVSGSGSSQKNKAVYVFDAVDRTAIIALLEAGTTTGTAADILASSTWTTALKGSGQMSSATTPGVDGMINLGDSVPSATPKSYFAVVFNKTEDLANTATKYYISADAAGQSYTATTQADRIVAAMSIAGVSSVTIPTAIPEPTSGLLLLLGVAGLALKRKYA